MIEYTTESMPESVKLFRANTVGFDNDDSPNYAGKEKVKSGLMSGGWRVTTYIGDREISDTMRYLDLPAPLGERKDGGLSIGEKPTFPSNSLIRETQRFEGDGNKLTFAERFIRWLFRL
jgi:hypothetical protein